jgi:hypothetical protein
MELEIILPCSLIPQIIPALRQMNPFYIILCFFYILRNIINPSMPRPAFSSGFSIQILYVSRF